MIEETPSIFVMTDHLEVSSVLAGPIIHSRRGTIR